jgi:trk system potassium uptake protein TrkA
MQRFAIIGLGRFGGRLAVNLASAGQEVIAVDNDAHLIEEFRDSVTLAIALDATDEQALLMHGLDKVDVAVVGIGDNFESNILATVLLKQLGVPRVISRAMSPMAARILSRIGADEVVEIQAPRSWLGKTLVELNLRAKLGVLIVAVKHREQQQGAVRQVVEFPNPNQPLQAQQSLVVMGPDESLAKLSGEDR